MTDDRTDEIIRHFAVVARSLDSEIRSVAEVVGSLVEGQKRLEFGQQVFLESVQRLETGQHALVESMNRLETAQQFFIERGNGVVPRVISASVGNLS